MVTVSMSIKAKPHSFKRHPTNRLDVPTSQRVVVSLEEVKDIAASRDLQLTVRELGPLYRIVCRDGKSDKIVGVTSGFIVPMLGLMHCDTLQIFTKGQRGEQGMRVRAGLLGLGLLMGGATFAFGRERGCRKAEILAIDDDGE